MKLAYVFAAFTLTTLASSWSPGQVVYEPVQYQYRAATNGPVYYYGGSDPLVHERAARIAADPTLSQRCMPVLVRPAVYADALPYVDVGRILGATPSEARNAAYRAVPTYFRKSDLPNR